MQRLPDLTPLYAKLRATYFRAPGGGSHLPPPDAVRVEWSNRLTASAGICYPRVRVIRLSTHYHKKYPDEIESTLLHEMIHLIVPGHGPEFYRWLERIRAAGGRVERYSKERALPKPARWRYTCVRCGQAALRIRRLANGGRHHRHRGCGGALREEALHS